MEHKQIQCGIKCRTAVNSTADRMATLPHSKQQMQMHQTSTLRTALMRKENGARLRNAPLHKKTRPQCDNVCDTGRLVSARVAVHDAESQSRRSLAAREKNAETLSGQWLPP